MDKLLLQTAILTTIIHIIDTFSYSVRLNSVKSKQYVLSTSLFNIFVLFSRTANTFLSPLIGSIIGASMAIDKDPIIKMRVIIFSATIGTVIGLIFIPTFLRIFKVAVSKLELTGSIPSFIMKSLSVGNIKKVAKKAVFPRKSMMEKLNFKTIPLQLLIVNTFITGIYTIGILASFYAAILVSPEKRLAVSASSGMINGIATILLTLLVDPKAAIITEQAIRGDRGYEDVKTLTVFLMGSKLIGTLLSQLLFLPSAKFLAWIYG